MSDLQSSFIFTTCQPGAEAALKAELAQRHPPEWRFAYSRPGFVTFKSVDGQNYGPDLVLNSVFARSFGISAGKASGETFEARIEHVRGESVKFGAQAIHVWSRERLEGRENRFDASFLIEKIRDDLNVKKRASGANFVAVVGQTAAAEGVVLDLIVVDENEWWIGFHTPHSGHRPWVGGLFKKDLPPRAPSRAYLKLEEGLVWSGLKPQAADVAVEFGAAPGGAAFALLERGLTVIGVDPGKMADQIKSHPKFTHLHCQAGQVNPKDLSKVRWVFSDMNLPPADVLRLFQKLAPVWNGRLKGGLITLKLKDWNTASELSVLADEFGNALGLKNARLAHLTNNRQEVCLALEASL